MRSLALQQALFNGQQSLFREAPRGLPVVADDPDIGSTPELEDSAEVKRATLQYGLFTGPHHLTRKPPRPVSPVMWSTTYSDPDLSIEYPDAPVFTRPPMKWAGGKRSLISLYQPHLPKRVSVFAEPFLGGAGFYMGHMFNYQRLVPGAKVFLSDANDELVNLYRVLQNAPRALIAELKQPRFSNTKDHYYKIRALHRARTLLHLPEHEIEKVKSRLGRYPDALARLLKAIRYCKAHPDTPVQRAARTIYLNRTAFNGLYRVCRYGLFNVPYGKYKKPNICNEVELVQAQHAFKGVAIRHEDFGSILHRLAVVDCPPEEVFIFLDPPYWPLAPSANFTSYTKGGFGADEQTRVAQIFRLLANRGYTVMLSNSDTPDVRKLYKGFTIIKVPVRRSINCNGKKRNAVGEVLVTSKRAA